MNIDRLLSGLLFVLLLSLPAVAGEPVVFLEKGKYGLKDSSTAAVILKARYDSIGKFHGDYALVRKKKSYGLLKKDGSLYLPVKFREILFPSCGGYRGEAYFFTSKKPGEYVQRSTNYYKMNAYEKVVYAPDRNWYGYLPEQTWVKITGDGYISTGLTGAELPVEKVPFGYTLFRGVIYDSEGKKIAENVGSATKQNIADRDFLQLRSTDGDFRLLEVRTGVMWSKEDKNSGIDGRYSSGYRTRVIKQGAIFEFSQIRDLDDFTLVENTEYGRYALQYEKRLLMPFVLTDIRMKKNQGSYLGTPCDILELESQKMLLEGDIENLAEALGHQGNTFIIVCKTPYGRSLFGNNGNELVHNNLENVYFKDDLMWVKADGETRIYDMTGISGLSAYDGYSMSKRGNLYNTDILVKKNGLWGLYSIGDGELVPPLYDNVGRYDGLLFVFRNGLTGVYDNNGHKMLDPLYKDVDASERNGSPRYFAVKTTSGHGALLSAVGMTVIPPGNFDSLNFLNGYDGKWCVAYKNGKIGIVDLRNGRMAIPCMYEDDIKSGSGVWPNKKIGLYKVSSNGSLLDIWTMRGRKLASRFVPNGTSRYTMLRYLENQLDADYVIDY